MIKYALIFTVMALALATYQVEAGQGCPFDDGSCQEYCNQQGCNLGYCGHFAWIQCICRKCGDEWNYYDKVRYNPDKTVNQTELDSLKLNSTGAPLIITGSTTQQQQVPASGGGDQQQRAQKKQEQTTKTLTTLLIPDLSDTNGRLGLNDMPDENSDNFLDYLAKNHERLAQATRAQEEEISAEEDQSSTTPSSSDEETIEIQISSSNNNTKADEQQQQVAGNGEVPATTQATVAAEQRQQQSSPVTRLLRMAVLERAPEDID